MLLTQERVLSD